MRGTGHGWDVVDPKLVARSDAADHTADLIVSALYERGTQAGRRWVAAYAPAHSA